MSSDSNSLFQQSQDWLQKRKGKIFLSNRLFWISISVISGTYILLIILLLFANIAYLFQSDSSPLQPIVTALNQPEIQNSLILSLISCTLSAFLATGVAIPIAYLLTRTQIRSRWVSFLDTLLDIPIILPPLVIGLSLLILFQFWPLSARVGDLLPFSTPWDNYVLNGFVVYQVPAVILAQFTVAAAFAIRAVKITFEKINPRTEQVALTLGCSRYQAFSRVLLPEAFSGILTAWTLAWARSLGEFGPLLIFAGATRNKTEVLSTSIFLELSIGNLEAAVAISLIMITAALIVLMIARIWGRSELIS